MAGTYDLPYTGNQVEILLGKVTALEEAMPTKVSDLTNDSGFITAASLPTKTSDLTNDSGFITQAAVPTKVSQLQNDSGFATETQVNTEKTRAQGVEGGLRNDVDAINLKIPAAASQLNKLADQAFVNSTVATATATFRGTSAAGLTEQQFLAWANGLTHDLNDYVFWNTVDSDENVVYKRYKWDGAQWLFEYDVNNSSFTAAQWSAINSGITDQLVTTFNAKYTKPANGIPASDMSSEVQTALGNAASAYQKPGTGIPKTDMENGVQSSIENSARMARDFGRYDNPVSVTLEQAVSGKYIDKDTALEVANANYGISSPIGLAMGDILLVPSASAVLAACSVVSRKVTSTYNKAIIYSYTYDDLNRVATAKADYDATLVYTAHYASDEASQPDYWTIGGQQVEALPSTHEVTESFYEPLVKQSVAAMPSEGYYIFLASETMEVVISGLTATVNGGVAVKVGWGIFKNIASNFVGIDKQRVIAEAIDSLFEQVRGLNNRLAEGLPHLRVDNLEIGNGIWGLLAGGTFVLRCKGAPSASLVPDNWDEKRYGAWQGIPLFSGQRLHDTTNKVIYEAIDTTAVTDWKRISNA